MAFWVWLARHLIKHLLSYYRGCTRVVRWQSWSLQHASDFEIVRTELTHFNTWFELPHPRVWPKPNSHSKWKDSTSIRVNDHSYFSDYIAFWGSEYSWPHWLARSKSISPSCFEMNSLAWTATFFDLESIGYAVFIKTETTFVKGRVRGTLVSNADILTNTVDCKSRPFVLFKLLT